uniref:NADH dehydrogenase [ubiquinone] iron-sulfur protein 5 n=1 Tax=Astatotilapia calliptera TaxID=8154 RepID=A0A3P8QR74_ASTCA
MPFVDLQSRLGINLDRWLLLQSGEQPNKRAARCHAFEKEWIECSHGIGQTRAKKECQLEFEDFYECMHRQKTLHWLPIEFRVHFKILHERLYAIRQQRDKLIKEGKYTPPSHHTGKAEQTP